MGDELKLSAGALFEELDGPLLEAAARPLGGPGRGKLLEADGTMKVAIIRPCISKGKRLGPKKLPPIYEAAMLQDHAGVFAGWPMYLDHMMEQAVEEMAEQLLEMGGQDLLGWLREKARSVQELGGRITESYWDPEVTYEDDEEYGYRPGAVVGKVIPQPTPLNMLEADPGILHVSINAWPKGAREGHASWDTSLRGMIIEGIRRKPRGSVDWVFRGGAGGRPLLEELSEDEVKVAVSVLEADYDAPQMKFKGKNLEDLKPDELREALQENAPHLLPALREAADPEDPEKKGKKGEPTDGKMSEDRVAEMLEESRKQTLAAIETKLEERADSVEEAAEKLVEEREVHRGLADIAKDLLEEAVHNGLPRDWAKKIQANYTLLPSGPTDGLLVEAVTEGDEPKTAEEVLKEKIGEDIQESIRLIRAGGGNPVITGLGASSEDPGGDGETKPAPRTSSFRDFLRDRGMVKEGDDAPSEGDQIGSMLEEAI